MRCTRSLLVLATLTAMTGCRYHYAPPELPMPSNTILLSEMMRELSARPGFTDGLLAELGDNGKRHGKKGPALLTPKLIDDLRTRILGKDWSGLDRFPGWTMKEINPTVRSVGHVAGKSEQLEDASAVHPGASPTSAQAGQYLDLGPYSLDKADITSLGRSSELPAFTTEGIVSTLGDGVTRGDGPNSLAPEHSESQRLAYVLNRLAANQLQGSERFSVTLLPGHRNDVKFGVGTEFPEAQAPQAKSSFVETPEDLIKLFEVSGHTVVVQDARYFANFGHFHYNGKGVMMPFWVNSQIIIPNTNRRPLLVPVAHAEYEWHVRGPHINADVASYYGVDGKSEWRTMDTLDQAWVLKRNAHTYTGADAVEVTRLAGLFTVAYMHLHAAHPTIPFGGYYAFGVCQDGVSAIEKKMTGKVTLFPNTADDSFFNDPRDAEVNALIAAIPKDRAGRMPEPERIFGSLPADPGPNGDFSAITIPGLAQDLAAVHFAWKEGSLQRTDHRLLKWVVYGALLLGGVFAISAMRRRNLHEV